MEVRVGMRVQIMMVCISWYFWKAGEKHFIESLSMKTESQVKISAWERVGNHSDLCISHRAQGAGSAS